METSSFCLLPPCRLLAGSRLRCCCVGAGSLQSWGWACCRLTHGPAPFATCSLVLFNLQLDPFATCSLNLCNLKLEPLQCAAGSFATCCNPTPEGMLFPPLLLFSPAIPKADCSSSPRNQGLICSLFFDSQTAPAIPSSLGHRAWSTASSQALGHDHSYAIHTH